MARKLKPFHPTNTLIQGSLYGYIQGSDDPQNNINFAEWVYMYTTIIIKCSKTIGSSQIHWEYLKQSSLYVVYMIYGIIWWWGFCSLCMHTVRHILWIYSPRRYIIVLCIGSIFGWLLSWCTGKHVLWDTAINPQPPLYGNQALGNI